MGAYLGAGLTGSLSGPTRPGRRYSSSLSGAVVHTVHTEGHAGCQWHPRHYSGALVGISLAGQLVLAVAEREARLAASVRGPKLKAGPGATGHRLGEMCSTSLVEGSLRVPLRLGFSLDTALRCTGSGYLFICFCFVSRCR